jgi:hypothetical protein
VSRAGPPRTAVCVLRVEPRGPGEVLITVTISSNVSLVSQRRSKSVARVGDALSLVASFLREYERSEKLGTEDP